MFFNFCLPFQRPGMNLCRSAFFLCFICFFSLKAQQKEESAREIGQHFYERLEETKRDYEDAVKKGDSLEVAEMCYRMGKRYCGLGDFETAQKWFIRSLNIREPLGYSAGVGKVYLFMNEYLIHEKQYRKANQLLQKAITNFKKSNAPINLLSGYLSMANLHNEGYQANQKYPEFSFDSAQYYYQLAEKLALRVNQPSDIANIHLCRGISLVNSNQQSGISYIKKAHAYYLGKEKLTYNLLNTMLHLGEAYLVFHKNQEAKIWLDKAKFVMDTSALGDYGQRAKLNLNYAILYENTSQWREGFKAQKQYHELVIQSLNADREGAVTRLSLIYEDKKKENKLQQQQQQTHIAMALGLLAVFTSIIFYLFFLKYKRLSKKNQVLVAEQNHRVKNNLQRVTNLLSLQLKPLQDEEAKKAITEALLRIEAIATVHKRLYDGDHLTEVELSSFIPELIEGILKSCNYPNLQPHYNLQSIWLHVDQAIPLGLILNELATNSCKYAFPFSTDPLLRVDCWLEKDRIHFKFLDNGHGFDGVKQRKSYGLKLIQVFTNQLKGVGAFEEGGRKFQLSFIKQERFIKEQKNSQNQNR